MAKKKTTRRLRRPPISPLMAGAAQEVTAYTRGLARKYHGTWVVDPTHAGIPRPGRQGALELHNCLIYERTGQVLLRDEGVERQRMHVKGWLGPKEAKRTFLVTNGLLLVHGYADQDRRWVKKLLADEAARGERQPLDVALTVRNMPAEIFGRIRVASDTVPGITAKMRGVGQTGVEETGLGASRREHPFLFVQLHEGSLEYIFRDDERWKDAPYDYSQCCNIFINKAEILEIRPRVPVDRRAKKR